MISYKERLEHISTFIFDVDGVLTNGNILLSNGDFLRTINTRDSFALRMAIQHHYPIFVITGGSSLLLQKHLLNIGITEVFLNSFDKLSVYESILDKQNLIDQEILYMGDDLPDIPVMRRVGCATCPDDAAVEVKEIAHYQSPYLGGRFAVRDVIEQTLRVQNKWIFDVKMNA